MATIRKRGEKYQVQVRHAGMRALSKSFHQLKDAQVWARQTEVLADKRDLPANPAALKQVTLGQLVMRYRDTVSVKKRGYENERISLNAFLHHPICRKRVFELRPEHFADYRDERLHDVKPSSLKRELGPIHHLFEVATAEWGLPIKENPLGRMTLKGADQRRERRLKPGELDKLIEAVRSCRNEFIGPVIAFALETGMRRGEIPPNQMKTLMLRY
jgi:integrase